jgi:hypothetical protein
MKTLEEMRRDTWYGVSLRGDDLHVEMRFLGRPNVRFRKDKNGIWLYCNAEHASEAYPNAKRCWTEMEEMC